MIESKKHQEYKPSDVDFIGDVPNHWEVMKLKYSIKISSGTGLTSADIEDEGKYKVYGGNGKIGFYLDFNSENNSLIIGRVGAKCGNVHISNEKVWITDNALIVKTTENYKYMYYCLTSINLNKLSTSTAQPLITGTDIKNYKIVLPPLNEQEKIANFLDTKNRQIKEFIKDKLHQIKLLEEQKEAIINKAVTKGLNDSVEFKDSGIEWIGDIPKHWEVRKLKYITDINKTTLTDKVDKNYKIKYIDISNVNTKGLIDEPLILKFGEAPSRAKRIVLKDDIILSTVRTYLKAIAYLENVEDNWIASTGFAVLTSKDMILSSYLYYVILSKYFIEQVGYRSVGVTYPSINVSDLGDIKVGLPSNEEQHLILDYIEIELSKIDKIITQIQQEIDLIQEYKISLISEVVTGQIKVV